MADAGKEEERVLEFSSRKHHVRLEAVERNGEDVILEARVRVDQFTARGACDVTLEQVRSWGTQLERLYETLRGEAVLAGRGLRIAVSGEGTGRVTVGGELDSDKGWGDGERAVLRFTLPPLDQTHLPPAISWVGQVAAMEQATGGCRDE